MKENQPVIAATQKKITPVFWNHVTALIKTLDKFCFPMLSAIQDYLREQIITPSELTELVFIHKQFETITAEDMKGLAQYENLEFVNFAEVGLKSISAPVPALPYCGTILFSNNNLTNDVLETLVKLENLESLALDGNKISSLDKFESLSGLAKLREISIAECPVTTTEGYREKLFAILPQVQIIDGMDREGNMIKLESEDDDDFSDDLEGSESVGDMNSDDPAQLGDLMGSDRDDDEEDEDGPPEPFSVDYYVPDPDAVNRDAVVQEARMVNSFISDSQIAMKIPQCFSGELEPLPIPADPLYVLPNSRFVVSSKRLVGTLMNKMITGFQFLCPNGTEVVTDAARMRIGVTIPGTLEFKVKFFKQSDSEILVAVRWDSGDWLAFIQIYSSIKKYLRHDEDEEDDEDDEEETEPVSKKSRN